MPNPTINNPSPSNVTRHPVSGQAGERLFPLPSSPPPKKNLQRYLETFRRGKTLFAAVAGALFAAIALYTFLIPPRFEAYCLLLINDDRTARKNSGEKTDEALHYGRIEGAAYGSRNLSNQMLILKQSLALAQRTAARLLSMKATPEGEPLTILTKGGAVLSADEVALRLQKEYIRIRRPGADVDIIEIAAVSRRAAEAAVIANLYADEYVELSRETSRQHISASRAFLETQIERRRAELADLEDRIKLYKSREGAVALDQESQHTILQIAQLEAQLDESRIERSMHEASLASIEEQLEKLHPVLARRVASGLETDIEQTQKKIAELELLVERIYLRNPHLRTTAASNPELADLTGQIERLKERVQRMSQQFVEEILAAGGLDPTSQKDGLTYITQLNRKLVDERIAISGANAKIAALEQRLAEYSRKLEAIPKQAMELAQLERSRRSTEELYSLLVGKLQEVRIAEESEVGAAQVVRSAIVPRKPVRPRTAVNLALGLVLGLLAGAGAAFIRQKIDTRLYTPDDITDNGYTLLTALPDLGEAVKRDCGGRPHTSFRDRQVSAMLVALYNPASPEAEAFRRLHLALIPPAAACPKTVCITSAEEGAGKSTVACNLAITMGKAGRRTVIVDADLFRPSIHTLLGLTAGEGLEAAARSLEHNSLRPESFTTGIENVWAVTSPRPIIHAGDLFAAPHIVALFQQLARTFDVVIIDAPPVLAATDAAFLAAQCETTLVVARAGGTDGEGLKQATACLAGAHASIRGIILNRFDPSRIYGYRFTYGYMYKDHTQSIPRT